MSQNASVARSETPAVFDATVGLPMVSTQSKLGRAENALFAYYTPGLTTTGMDWCHGSDRKQLEKKVVQHLARLKEQAAENSREFDSERVMDLLYRPFTKRSFYHDAALHEVLDRTAVFFGADGNALNTCILLVDGGAGRPLTIGASDMLAHQRFLGPGSTVHMVAMHRIGADGRRSENITDHGLERFREHYGPRPVSSLADGVDPRVPSTLTAVRAARAQGLKRPEVRPPASSVINPTAVFHYVYAVLHDPLRPLPHGGGSFISPIIPFHPDFEAWNDRGRRLIELHTGFEMVEPWPLEVHTAGGLGRGADPAGPLLIDRENGTMRIDRYTTVLGIPPEAWSFTLGNRSALEWALDGNKERTGTRSNGATYSGRVQQVVQRIRKVCRVSMETYRIRKEIAALTR